MVELCGQRSNGYWQRTVDELYDEEQVDELGLELDVELEAVEQDTIDGLDEILCFDVGAAELNAPAAV